MKVVPINTDTKDQSNPVTLRITSEEQNLNSKEDAKSKCKCCYGSTSCTDLEYAYYQIRKKFPEWPDSEKYKFSMPNTAFLNSAPPENYFYHHSFSHNRLTSQEFNRILNYFNKENQAVKRRLSKWKKFRIGLFFGKIGLTVLLFVLLFTTGIVTDRAMTLYFSLFAMLVYTFFLVTIHVSTIKSVLLYNMKAFLLQVGLEQLQSRDVSLQCDEKKLSVNRSLVEYDEFNEHLLDLSNNCVKVLPEPDIFRYYFSSDLTASCQKEMFDPEVVDRKFTLEDFEQLKKSVRKAHPFATRYFKMTAFPRWLTLSLYPCWIIIYMICVFAIPDGSVPVDQRSLGLLAPVYTVLVPHVVAGIIFLIFRYLPNAFLKPRINNTCLKLSVKIFKGKKAAFRVNTQNNAMYLFSLDPKVAPLPIKRKVPNFLDLLDAKDVKDMDPVGVSTTDDEGKSEPPLESNDLRPKEPRKKKIELHKLGDRRMPKVTVSSDDIPSYMPGQRAYRKFFCAHSNMTFEDADQHNLHCVAHTQKFTIQAGKHGVENHYLDQQPSMKIKKDFIKAKREEMMSRNDNTSILMHRPMTTQQDLNINSIVNTNESMMPDSVRILDTSLNGQLQNVKDINYLAALERILEEDGSAKLKDNYFRADSIQSRENALTPRNIPDDVSEFTMHDIATYIEQI